MLEGLLSVARERPAMRPFVMHTQRLEPVFAHIEEHLTKPLKTADLARKAGLSVSRFIQIFKAVTGMPPLRYAIKIRLQRAMELLAATDAPIAAVGEQAGWPDQFHFCRIFKAQLGVTPSTYRNTQAGMMN